MLLVGVAHEDSLAMPQFIATPRRIGDPIELIHGQELWNAGSTHSSFILNPGYLRSPKTFTRYALYVNSRRIRV